MLVAASLALGGQAQAVTITEFPIEVGAPASAHSPYSIEAGPDGALWFTDLGTGFGIGRIATTGQLAAPLVTAGPPQDLIVAPDRTVYWTVINPGGLTRRTPDGTTTTNPTESGATFVPYAPGLDAQGKPWYSAQVNSGWVCEAFRTPQNRCFASPSAATRFTSLTLGPDNKFWIAAFEENQVRRFDPGANPPVYDLAINNLPPNSGPGRIAAGPDGNLWVAMYKASAIDRITPAGNRTRFQLPAGRGPNDISLGPDGALWFTEFDGNAIGRITTNGTVTNEFALPTAGSHPWGITTGPDGALWYTANATGKIGRLVLDGPGGQGGALKDGVAPKFSKRLGLERKRFRVASGATPVSLARKAKRGSAFKFSLSEPAQVSITIARPEKGRRVGGSCRKPTRSNRKRRRCTRYVSKGTLRRRGLQGANRVAFTGRIGKRKLAAGRYRARATAKDAAGNTSKASSAFFTIAR
jgi:virginiamycin B lyase